MTIHDSARTILCFGDSNTWGVVPGSTKRYPRSIRWPAVLQTLLGTQYEVISEGLSGRTLVAVDPNRPYGSGITYLKPTLESSNPLDIIIILLGTNDVKNIYNLEAADIAKHLEEVISLIHGSQPFPKILVVCPPPPIPPQTGTLDPRMVRGPRIFQTLPTLFQQVADKHGCAYINAGNHITSSAVDGYHWDAATHLEFAKILHSTIKKWDISE